MFEGCQQVDGAHNPANPRPSWGADDTVCRDRAEISSPSNSCIPAKSRQDAAFAPYRKNFHAAKSALTERKPFSHVFMQEIPEEILHAILANAVRGHYDLATIALCCKRWRGFSLLDEPWKKLSIRGWGHRADIIQVPINKEPVISWREYYRSRLLSHLTECSYLKRQQQMTASIRSILINWLLAVLDEFQQDDEYGGVFPAAHHQTVALFDRYCNAEAETIQTYELQMIGAACAVLALHSGEAVEDIDLSFFNKASFYTDGACTAEEVQAVALKIVRFLPGETLPTLETACSHIDVLLTVMQKNYPSSSTFCLAHYLGELALQAEVSLKYAAKTVGAAAYALSCHTLGWPETLWMPIVRAHSGDLTLRSLQPCMADLQALLTQALSMLTKRNKRGTLPHVIVKYCRRERQHVAKVIVTPSPWPTVCPHGHSRVASDAEPCADCDAAPEEHPPAEHPTIVPEGLLNAAPGAPPTEEPAHAHANAAPAGGAGSTPRDLSAEREATRTPANSHEGGGSGGGAGGGGVVERFLAREEEGARQGGQGQGLQDVSFGAISDNNDNSFLNEPCDDKDSRRASMGEAGGRRASLGSVLGAVHEELPAGGAQKHGVVLEEEEWGEVGVDMDEVEAGLSDISFDCDREDLDAPTSHCDPAGQLVC